MTLEDETKDEYINLMDFNTEFCIDGQTLLRNMDHYRVDLVILKKIDNGIITVYFNQTVDCNETQVLCSHIKTLLKCKHILFHRNVPCLFSGDKHMEIQLVMSRKIPEALSADRNWK